MNRTPRARRARRLGWALILASPVAGLAAVPAAAAPTPVVEQAPVIEQALDLCRGNNQIFVAPYSCSRTREIDGISFTATLVVTASGGLTVTITMPEPQDFDVPIRYRSHQGISSGPTTMEASGIIPAGQTSGTLSGQIGCGQIDVKAIFTGNGDASGRITAPYITTVNNCQVLGATTTVATTIPTTTEVTQTTAAQTTTTGQTTTTDAGSVTTVPGTTGTVPPGLSPSSPTTAASGTRLPETGGSVPWGPGLAALVFAAGVVLIAIGRRTATP